MAVDFLPGMSPGPAGSVTRAVPVVPADNVPLPMVARRIWVGVSGNIQMQLRDDQVPVTIMNMPVGMHQFWVSQIWATGTTASQIVALA